jgi:hypothetical protein
VAMHTKLIVTELEMAFKRKSEDSGLGYHFRLNKRNPPGWR